MIEVGWEAKKRIDKGRKVDNVGVFGVWMKNRLEAVVRIGERVDSDFKVAFESTAIGADVKFDVVDGGGHR